jgi:hypothetical protein
LEIADSNDKSTAANLKAKQAELVAGQANELAAKIGITNAQLVAANLVLQSEIQPRMITASQINRFIFLTEKINKISIKVSIGPVNGDNESYAYQIRGLLTSAKFKIETNSDYMGLARRDDHYTRPAGANGKISEVLLYSYSTNEWMENPSLMTGWTPGENTTNGFRPMPPRNDTDGYEAARTYWAILYVFNELKIPTEVYGSPNVKPGEFEFFILPRHL